MTASHWLLGMWAKTGDPNGEGLPQWPTLDDESNEIMELGDTFGARRACTPGQRALFY